MYGHNLTNSWTGKNGYDDVGENSNQSFLPSQTYAIEAVLLYSLYGNYREHLKIMKGILEEERI